MTTLRVGSSGPWVISPRTAIASAVRRYLPAVIVFVVLMVVWEAIVPRTGRRPLPPPTQIANALLTEGAILYPAAWNTLYSALGGLFIGTIAGVAVAFMASRWVLARDVLLPLAVGASAVPLIALAPILNNWFGVLDPFSKMMMAALLVFFPITINVVRGLVEVQPQALELMRSYAASDIELLRRVRIPNMLPYFFTALKVGTTLAFIGAIVGEFFGGSTVVLGRLILKSISGGRFDMAWAVIVLGSMAAIVSYLVVALIERLVIPWYVSMREGAG
jgi:NitT/TauT family transport system permease protein